MLPNTYYPGGRRKNRAAGRKGGGGGSVEHALDRPKEANTGTEALHMSHPGGRAWCLSC